MTDTVKPFIIDIDAFDVVPKRNVKVGEQTYPAFSLVDVPYPVYLKATRLEEHLAAITDEQDQVRFIADLVQSFIPSLPSEVILGGKGHRGMSMRSIGILVGLLCTPMTDEVGPEEDSDPLAVKPDA